MGVEWRRTDNEEAGRELVRAFSSPEAIELAPIYDDMMENIRVRYVILKDRQIMHVE